MHNYFVIKSQEEEGEQVCRILLRLSQCCWKGVKRMINVGGLEGGIYSSPCDVNTFGYTILLLTCLKHRRVPSRRRKRRMKGLPEANPWECVTLLGCTSCRRFVLLYRSCCACGLDACVLQLLVV